MFKQFSIAGADVYLVSSMLMFIAFFVFVTYKVITMSKKEIKELEKLPLE